MTQELIAHMLDGRREGVTEAALKLQRAGLTVTRAAMSRCWIGQAWSFDAANAMPSSTRSTPPASETHGNVDPWPAAHIRCRHARSGRLGWVFRFVPGIRQAHQVPVRRRIRADAGKDRPLRPVLGAQLEHT